MGKLSDKQELFCNEYIIDFNATQAAIRAKYSKSTARQIGSDTLSKVDIRERISELINEQLGTQRDELRLKVIRELNIIAFTDVTKDINVVTETVIRDGQELEYQRVEIIDTKNSEQSKAIAGIKKTDKGIEVKYHDKTKALELLGKYGTLWNDNINLNIKIKEPDMSNFTKQELKDLARLNRKRKS